MTSLQYPGDDSSYASSYQYDAMGRPAANGEPFLQFLPEMFLLLGEHYDRAMLRPFDALHL